MSNQVMSWVLEQQLATLQQEAITAELLALDAQDSWQEAKLFIERAAARLDVNDPLHPLNRNQLLDDEYISQLAAAFEAQEQLQHETKLAEYGEDLGIEDVQLPDEYKGFDIAEWNEKAFEKAEEANANE